VINALKHAFPDQSHGRIVAEYDSDGPKWTLSVKNDSIGMPSGRPRAKAGVGTGIIEALAGHLHAGIDVLDAAPGTAITISGALSRIA
jgi:two-component sensor histidine kinase